MPVDNKSSLLEGYFYCVLSGYAFNKGGAAGAVTGVGNSVPHGIDLQSVGVAELFFVVVTVGYIAFDLHLRCSHTGSPFHLFIHDLS